MCISNLYFSAYICHRRFCFPFICFSDICFVSMLLCLYLPIYLLFICVPISHLPTLCLSSFQSIFLPVYISFCLSRLQSVFTSVYLNSFFYKIFFFPLNLSSPSGLFLSLSFCLPLCLSFYLFICCLSICVLKF